MSDLRGRIDRLERGVGARSGRSRWRALLAPYVAAAVYDGCREALLDALCGPNPTYHFAVEDGPERGQYWVWWWARSRPPVVMRIQRVDGREDSAEPGMEGRG